MRAHEVKRSCDRSTSDVGDLTIADESLFGEHAMHELHARGALAHRGGNSFDAARANVADRENARHICFEQMRLTGKGPACSA